MEQIDRLGWEAARSFLAYGVRVGVRVRGGALPNLDGRLPPGAREGRYRTVDRMYSIVAAKEGQRRGVRPFHLLYGDAELLARTTEPALITVALRDDCELRVAELAPDFVFVHAGVVGWRGRALVLPGVSRAGKSTLVAALVARGATYYSDEYAVIDRRGHVWPYARPLALREGRVAPPVAAMGEGPLPVGAIVFATYRKGARGQFAERPAGRVTLGLLENTLGARRRPDEALATLGRVARAATAWQGERGEAARTARWLLDEVMR